MKQIFLAAVISLSSLLISQAQVTYSTIKGKVVNWPTDTVYLQCMTFYSPYSSETKMQKLDNDSTFSFKLKNKDIPLIVQLYWNSDNVELNKMELVFLNYDPDYYYYGHCRKFYTYAVSTFLLEPEKTLNVKLTANRTFEKLNDEKAERYRKIGAKVLENNTIETIRETTIEFYGENIFSCEYFQKSFNLVNIVDKRLELYRNKPIEKVVESYTKIKNKLLDHLEAEKGNLSAISYEYLKAEIEFGARVEFLKFLMFQNAEGSVIMDSLFANKIPQTILDVVEFDKIKISPVVMASEAYNKYLELYLTFKMNVQNLMFLNFYEFSMSKCKTAINELPEMSAYYYLAGQLLHTMRTESFVEDLVISTIKKFPEGELNDLLLEKYDL